MGMANRHGAALREEALERLDEGVGGQACADDVRVEVLHVAHDASPG
jgi:hypothetical protein